jgi:hypothetical protein
LVCSHCAAHRERWAPKALNLFCSALALLFSASAFVALLTIYLKANMTIFYINLVDVEVDLDGRKDVALDAEVHNSCSCECRCTKHVLVHLLCTCSCSCSSFSLCCIDILMDIDIDTDIDTDVAHVQVHKAAPL